jgi:hypothetical protein
MRRWWIVPTTVLGEITAVAVDSENQLWVLHRPRSLSEEDQPNAVPAAMLFDRTGTYVRGFGGPATAWEWPAIEHSIAVDKSGRVWIAGNSRTDPGAGDDMLLEFTNDGKLIYQIGRRGASMGDLDTANLHAPAHIFVDDAAHETYVADGYANRGVIAFSTDVEQRYLYIADWGNSAVPVLDRATLATVGTIGDNGTAPGEFTGPHPIATDSKGVLYVVEVQGRRKLRLVPVGR